MRRWIGDRRLGWLSGGASREGRADPVEEGEERLRGEGLEDEAEGEGEEDDADDGGVVPGRNERARGVVAAVVEKVHGYVEVGLEPGGLVVGEVEEHSEHDRGKDLEALGSAGRVLAGVEVVFSGGDDEGLDGSRERVQDDLVVDGSLNSSRSSGSVVTRDEARDQ